MVWGNCSPVPCKLILCLAGLPFSALSVKLAVLLRGPLAVGVKLMLRLQLAPGASEKLALQSSGVPLPGTCPKFAPTARPVEIAVSCWLPLF